MERTSLGQEKEIDFSEEIPGTVKEEKE